jgi:hypothetical protein
VACQPADTAAIEREVGIITECSITVPNKVGGVVVSIGRIAYTEYTVVEIYLIVGAEAKVIA